MAGVAGLRGTGDWGTDERPKDFRESILFFSPNGDAPLFALTSKAGKKTVKDPEFSWWAESQTHVRLTTSAAGTSTQTSITILASADPTATQMDNLYRTATHLKAGDLLLVEPATDTSTWTPEIMEVVSISSDTSFVVSRGAAGTTAASFNATAAFTLIGSAYAEGTPAPAAVSRNPVKFFNYTQIFKETYELTGTADETETRTGSPWSNDKKRKSYDHARGIELSMLFGVRSETTGSNGKPKRTMGSLRTFIPAARQTILTTSLGGLGTNAPSSLLDAISVAYDFDMGGGDTRIGFIGNFARTDMGKAIQNATGVRMELGSVIKMWGMNFQELIMPQGRLLLKSHPLLSVHPVYKKSLFVCDFSAIKYTALRNRDTRFKDDVQTKDEDVRRGFVQTECSVMVDGGGLSLAYVGNISYT